MPKRSLSQQESLTGKLTYRMQEIERKFLVTSDAYKNEAFRRTHIVQGFLSTHPERTVRIRIRGNEGFLTIKGKSDESGVSRFEWERQISLAEAEDLMRLCEPGRVEKTRFEIESGDHIFEVDEFIGENEGLVMAEIELKSENEAFPSPAWLGKEVTGDKRYYNSHLSKKPFKEWD